MIASQALEAWAKDAKARSRTMAGVEAFSRRFADLPALVELERRLGQAAVEPEAILAAASPFLADDAAVGACMAALIGAAREDPFFRPPLRNASSEILHGLVLLDRPLMTLFIAVIPAEKLAAKRVFRAGPASIAFTGNRSVYHFLKTGGATLSLWEAPAIEAGFSADSSGRCRLVERRRIAEGETLALDGARHGFVIDHAVSDILYVQASTPVGAAALMAEYDCETGVLVGASSTDEASSRIQLMLALLRTLGRTDASPIFERMLASPHFYARWQAMREYLALDAEAAAPHLREMAQADPHPEVRAAAAETLARFFAEEREPCLG